MTNPETWFPLSGFFGHAQSEGWILDQQRTSRRLRELASEAKIPAKLIHGKWQYNPELVHDIAKLVGMVRAGRRHTA